MKKPLTFMLLLLASLATLATVSAQNSLVDQPNSAKVKNYISLSFDRATVDSGDPYEGQISYSSKLIDRSDILGVESYKALIAQGAQTSKVANHIIISVGGYAGYTKAELIYKPTSAVLMDVYLTEESQQIDVSQIPSGDYRMVLSNDAGKIKVEKLIIY